MSIWETYPNLPVSDLRALVAVAAQVLLDLDTESADSLDVLQQSTATSARELEPLLKEVNSNVTRQNLQKALEDEEIATRVSVGVLDQVRTYPELAERVAQAFEARKQKMTGVELILLAGALVILAMRVKRVKIGAGAGSIDFEPAGEAVKTFVAGLVAGLAKGTG